MEKRIPLSKVVESGLMPYSAWKLQEKCRLREVPCYKEGGRYYFLMSELEEWWKDRKQKVIKNFRVEVVREITVKS